MIPMGGRTIGFAAACLAAMLAQASTSFAEPSYVLGVGAECAEDAGYQSIPVSAGLPSLMQFLARSTGADPVMAIANIGGVRQPGSGGSINVRRGSFALTLRLPPDGFYHLDGTVEIFDPKAFCQILENGLRFEITAGGELLGSLRLAPESSHVVIEPEEARADTLDRIGRRYFSDLRFFLASDFSWFADAWLPTNVNPFDFNEAPEYSLSTWRSLLQGDRCYNYEYHSSICSYMERIDAAEALLSFVQTAELYLVDFPSTPAALQLSLMPFVIEGLGSQCLLFSVTDAAETPRVEFCQHEGRLVLFSPTRSSRSTENAGLPAPRGE
ncbi:hypothetical protein [Sinorhizobium meliloti]|uniref:hypothetical protein n=1 Tax=Rhizobium meliloti TaxID=382 RepID=UPI0018E7D1F3|nr:hypothetical protein [Sinorhizobium meliloti]QQF06235.1 hypothetical protein JFX10_24815 [Sinorhizobium meliloti]